MSQEHLQSFSDYDRNTKITNINELVILLFELDDKRTGLKAKDHQLSDELFVIDNSGEVVYL